MRAAGTHKGLFHILSLVRVRPWIYIQDSSLWLDLNGLNGLSPTKEVQINIEAQCFSVTVHYYYEIISPVFLRLHNS